jgi:hypothetical protein
MEARCEPLAASRDGARGTTKLKSEMKMEVDEEKITRLLRIIEDNIEEEIRAERECAETAWEYQLRGLPVIPAHSGDRDH